MILSIELFLCVSVSGARAGLGWFGFVRSLRLSVEVCGKDVRKWKGYSIVLGCSSMLQ
jgi:hypothetical protein